MTLVEIASLEAAPDAYSGARPAARLCHGGAWLTVVDSVVDPGWRAGDGAGPV